MSYSINTINMNNIYPSSNESSTGLLSTKSVSPSSLSLIGRKTENKLLNTQARIEYELFKSGIVSGVVGINKLLDLDDQVLVQEYKLCTSLRYRKRVFVMEFRQLPTDNKLYNHALDLIFQGANQKSNTSGRTTLVLAKEGGQFGVN